MAQPSDEDIDNVISFTGFTDRNLIAAALKVGAFPATSNAQSPNRDGNPC